MSKKELVANRQYTDEFKAEALQTATPPQRAVIVAVEISLGVCAG